MGWNINMLIAVAAGFSRWSLDGNRFGSFRPGVPKPFFFELWAKSNTYCNRIDKMQMELGAIRWHEPVQGDVRCSEVVTTWSLSWLVVWVYWNRFPSLKKKKKILLRIWKYIHSEIQNIESSQWVLCGSKAPVRIWLTASTGCNNITVWSLSWLAAASITECLDGTNSSADGHEVTPPCRCWGGGGNTRIHYYTLLLHEYQHTKL